MPDKSVSVLDTACAKVAIGQGATPASIEDATRRIQNLTSEIDSLEREQATGAEHDTRLEELKAKRTETDAELAKLQEQWTKEKDLTDKIRTVRTKLEMSRLDSKLADIKAGTNGKASRNGEGAAAAAAGAAEPAIAGDGAATETAAAATMSAAETGVEDSTATAAAPAPETLKPIDTEFLKGELKRLNAELKEVQGEDPLMQPVVNGQTVAEVISGWTGIPDRQNGRRRDQCGVESCRNASRTSSRPGSRSRGDLSENPNIACRPDRSETARSACSCSSAHQASVKPKPRLPLPNRFTAASGT